MRQDLRKTDWNYEQQFEGKYDGEGVNMGFYDKMEVEAVLGDLPMEVLDEFSMVPVSTLGTF